ncbi:MAG: LysR substrate-binding domain-containing protein [Ilumatobacteraceae bacterium]
MQWTFRQLEYFAAAAQHGSATRAARVLHVSQPSISKAIAELEAMWGEQLFVRLPAKGLELTPAGAERHRQVRRLLAQAAGLTGAAAQGLTGLLRVGCLSTLGPRYLPAILARLQAEFPDIEVQLQESDTEMLLAKVERGALDIALLYDLGLARKVQLEPIAELWPHVLLPSGHRLARRRQIALAEIATEPFVLINLPGSRDYFLSLFRSEGLVPHVVHETGSLTMARGLVANGLGVSVLTTRAAHDLAEDGKEVVARPLRGPVQPQRVVLAQPVGPPAQPDLVAAFTRATRAVL